MKKSFIRNAIINVLTYIDNHKDSDIKLDALAQIAGISKFHFHRLFKEYMGISIGQYIKLKRLETGMWKLIYTDNNTLEIALDSGYESHAAFTRAFKKEMGCSPKEFKENFYKDKIIALNKRQQTGPLFLGYQKREKTDVFYVRETGSYFISPHQAWETLINDLETCGINTEKLIYYGIAQDDPNAVDSELEYLRFDICVEASKEIIQHEHELKARKSQIKEGTYAVFQHKGPLERLTDSYYFIYGRWIYENPITLRDCRPFIKYKDPFNTAVSENEKETVIYIPISDFDI